MDTSEPFLETEVLYRRVSPDEIQITGELDASRFSIRQFGKDVSGSPSVVRSRYALPDDVLHPNCANGKSYDNYSVYRIAVVDLPQQIVSQDGKQFSAYAVHLPEPACGAHSVIATCIANDAQRTYAKPSRTAINDLRAKLAVRFDAQPAREDIARIAYSLWQNDGLGEGQYKDWLSAERQLIQAKRDSIAGGASRYSS